MNRFALTVATIVFAILGIGSAAFVVSKCGAAGLFLGNSGVAVAAMGMCDK